MTRCFRAARTSTKRQRKSQSAKQKGQQCSSNNWLSHPCDPPCKFFAFTNTPASLSKLHQTDELHSSGKLPTTGGTDPHSTRETSDSFWGNSLDIRKGLDDWISELVFGLWSWALGWFQRPKT